MIKVNIKNVRRISRTIGTRVFLFVFTVNKKAKAVNYLRTKVPPQMFDRVLTR